MATSGFFPAILAKPMQRCRSGQYLKDYSSLLRIGNTVIAETVELKPSVERSFDRTGIIHIVERSVQATDGIARGGAGFIRTTANHQLCRGTSRFTENRARGDRVYTQATA